MSSPAPWSPRGAQQMANGVRRLLEADVSVALTGVGAGGVGHGGPG
ncbi:CinA family protein [Nocardioides sp. LHG3406-4]